jgi:hypothetical protein
MALVEAPVGQDLVEAKAMIDLKRAAEAAEDALVSQRADPNHFVAIDWELIALAAIRASGVVEVAEALLTKLDAAQPHIDGMAELCHIHSEPYNGPTYGEEREALRAALAMLKGD